VSNLNNTQKTAMNFKVFTSIEKPVLWGWEWWYVPVIPATQEVEVGRIVA
jgi:hypothetical protein